MNGDVMREGLQIEAYLIVIKDLVRTENHILPCDR